MDPARRSLLRAGTLLPAAAALSSLPAKASARYAAPMQIPATTAAPDVLARDEGYWAAVASHFDITDEVNHLENGYWGAMGRETLASYQRHTAEVNRGNAWYGRREFPAQYMAVQRQVAELLGVGADEIALTRGATEAMLALIGGYNRLQPGDQVLYADIDYDSMITAMQWLGERRGVRSVAIAMPEPFTHAAVLETYRQALAAHPRTRLLLLTHVNHRNGMLLPVADIAALARAAGVEVVLDAAHGIGQVDSVLPALGVAFAGINLHKWIGAPVGLGALYIRRDRIADVAPYLGEHDDGRIDARVHTGTLNFAACLALPTALALHARIGVANKRARLLRLRNQWLEALHGDDRIERLASPDPRLSSAIAAFRLRGQTTMAANTATAERMLRGHGVFVVPRDGLASGACLRVTPGIFTPPAQIETLVAAIRAVAG